MPSESREFKGNSEGHYAPVMTPNESPGTVKQPARLSPSA